MATLTTDARSDFDSTLQSILPRLRVYALSLTRNSDQADDLVQQTALKALAGRASFRPGTNFPGWLFRIQRNEFISGRRRERPSVQIEDAHSVSERALQESSVYVREVLRSFRKLPATARHALILANLGGHSYEQIAGQHAISVGTVKSRISRARARLRQTLEPEIARLKAPGA